VWLFKENARKGSARPWKFFCKTGWLVETQQLKLDLVGFYLFSFTNFAFDFHGFHLK